MIDRLQAFWKHDAMQGPEESYAKCPPEEGVSASLWLVSSSRLLLVSFQTLSKVKGPREVDPFPGNEDICRAIGSGAQADMAVLCGGNLRTT